LQGFCAKKSSVLYGAPERRIRFRPRNQTDKIRLLKFNKIYQPDLQDKKHVVISSIHALHRAFAF